MYICFLLHLAQGPSGLGPNKVWEIRKMVASAFYRKPLPPLSRQAPVSGHLRPFTSCLFTLLPFTQSESWGEVTPEGVFTRAR